MRGLAGIELTDEIVKALVFGAAENETLATDIRENEALQFLLQKWSDKVRVRLQLLAMRKGSVLKEIDYLDMEIEQIKARTKLSGT